MTQRLTEFILDELTADPSSPPNGCIWYRSDLEVLLARMTGVTETIALWKHLSPVSFDADQLLSPNSSDWKVNAHAALAVDSNNAALAVRRFDDTVEEGVGLLVRPPPWSSSVIVKPTSRAETSPAGARTVGLKLYNRGIPDAAAVQAWTAGTALADIDIPTNENFQEDTQSMTLASLSLTAGELTQLEITRVAPSSGTDLEGDWCLLRLEIGWN